MHSESLSILVATKTFLERPWGRRYKMTALTINITLSLNLSTSSMVWLTPHTLILILSFTNLREILRTWWPMTIRETSKRTRGSYNISEEKQSMWSQETLSGYPKEEIGSPRVKTPSIAITNTKKRIKSSSGWILRRNLTWSRLANLIIWSLQLLDPELLNLKLILKTINQEVKLIQLFN